MITFASIVAYLIGILNSVVKVLAALAVVFFMWGMAQYVYKPSDKHKYKNVQWSLLAIFILFSIWGIINLMCASLSLCSTAPTTTPTSYIPSTP